MIKFLKNIFLFSIFLIIVYPFLIFLSGYLPIPQALKPNLTYKIGSYGHMFTRLNELKQLEGYVDILFLGSSHSYRGFDPRNFKDKKVFNLGSSSQTPIQTKILLERYLSKLNPKVVIYEVYPDTFSPDGVESSLDLIANDKNDFKSIKMGFELNNIKTYNTLIYAEFSDFFNLNKHFVEPAKKDNDTYISGGYVEKEMSCYKYIEHPKKNWVFNQIQMKSFNDCLNILRKKNIKTILVYAPITSKLYGSYINNNYIENIFNSFSLDYYNFNKLMQLNDSLDFFDADHLNQNGVNTFNTKLKRLLKL